MIVIECEHLLMREDYENALKEFQEQARNGVILLTPGFVLVGADKPLKIVSLPDAGSFKAELLAPIKGE